LSKRAAEAALVSLATGGELCKHCCAVYRPSSMGINRMRYVIAVLLVCALAAPAASAASSKSSAKSVSASKSDQGTKSGKRTRQGSQSKGLGGIHPLVGSGDY
jgi:hypothetical protein